MAKHRFSGWPGAFCLDCGADDAMENAIGMCWYDPYEDTWDTQDHKQIVSFCANNCPVEDKNKKPISEIYKSKEKE